MLVIYILLACLSMLCFAAGFSVHAFYFTERRIRALRAEVEKLQRLLGEKQGEVTEAQDEIAKTSELVRSMELQVRRRQKELEGLQQIAARQDEEIGSLQRDAEAIRTALLAAGTLSLSPAPTGADSFRTLQMAISTSAAVSGPVVAELGRLSTSEKTPGWRNNLDTILASLDKMGSAIERER
jgi:DNA repair exonuclease SbcCD ATPase subunit